LQHQCSSPTLGTVVLLLPDHLTRVAFVVSRIIQRLLDYVGGTIPAVIFRELLPCSSPVLGRFRQVSDHHADVSFAEFGRFFGAIFRGPSVRSVYDLSLLARWHACLLLNVVACVAGYSQCFDNSTRRRVPFVFFGWLQSWRANFVMRTLEDPDRRHCMIELNQIFGGRVLDY
jgi:hypothetical protein